MGPETSDYSKYGGPRRDGRLAEPHGERPRATHEHHLQRPFDQSEVARAPRARRERRQQLRHPEALGAGRVDTQDRNDAAGLDHAPQLGAGCRAVVHKVDDGLHEHRLDSTFRQRDRFGTTSEPPNRGVARARDVEHPLRRVNAHDRAAMALRQRCGKAAGSQPRSSTDRPARSASRLSSASTSSNSSIAQRVVAGGGRVEVGPRHAGTVA